MRYENQKINVLPISYSFTRQPEEKNRKSKGSGLNKKLFIKTIQFILKRIFELPFAFDILFELGIISKLLFFVK